MNCEQMNDLLWAFLDGELTAQEEEQMHAHLEQCADCRALLEQLQTLRTSFSDLEEIPAPEGFADGVMNRIKAESKPKVIPLFKRPQIRAFTAMAACAALFVGFGSIRMGSSKGEAAPMAPAPEAAVYDAAPAAAAPESPMEYSVASGAESKAVEAPAAAPMEPCAPAPAVEELPSEEGIQDPMTTTICPSGPVMDTVAEIAEVQLYLNRLPDGAEDAIGPILWEENVEDGTQSAVLTPEQGKILVELAQEQGITVEMGIPADTQVVRWRVSLLP